MANKVKRNKTKYKNIYLNESTKKYDVKYNYKIYNPLKQKNEYKAKWKYGLETLAEAKSELAKLQTGSYKTCTTDVTLCGTFELWKTQVTARNFSPATIQNTERNLKILSQFISLEIKLKNIDASTYYDVIAKCREHGYADETIRTLNATFRKLIEFAYRNGLIQENFLHKTYSIKTKVIKKTRILSHDEFAKINDYLEHAEYILLGRNIYARRQFLYNVLYFTGIRLGECLALTWEDFEQLSSGMRLNINKSILPDGTIKEPKNYKFRTIPLDSRVAALYEREWNYHLEHGGNVTDKVFPYKQAYCRQLLQKICKTLGLESCKCHTFRHTFISNLIKNNVPISVIEKVSGDTQRTILAVYSHMFEGDEQIVLKALEKL